MKIINGVKCRTAAEAKADILKAIEDDKIGARTPGGRFAVTSACLYRDATGRGCGVGVLFNDLQIRDIKRRGMNSRPVANLMNVFGKANIEAVTGLSIGQLNELQRAHDKLAWREDRELDKAEFTTSIEAILGAETN